MVLHEHGSHRCGDRAPERSRLREPLACGRSRIGSDAWVVRVLGVRRGHRKSSKRRGGTFFERRGRRSLDEHCVVEVAAGARFVVFTMRISEVMPCIALPHAFRGAGS